MAESMFFTTRHKRLLTGVSMLRTPSLTVDKTDHDTYLQTRLRSLSAGFDVDVSAAAGLTGQALKDWLNAAEDVLFSECLNDLAAMKQERATWSNKGNSL